VESLFVDLAFAAADLVVTMIERFDRLKQTTPDVALIPQQMLIQNCP